MEGKTDTGAKNTLPQHASGMCAMPEKRVTPTLQQPREQADCGSFSMNEMLDALDTLARRQDEQMGALRLVHQESLAQLQDELSSWMEWHGQQLAQMLASINSIRGRSQASSFDKALVMGSDESPCARNIAAEGVTHTQCSLTETESEKDLYKSMFTRLFPRSGMTRAFVDNKLRESSRSQGIPGTQDTAVRRLVRTQRFENLSGFLVITNAMFVGVQVECMFHTIETPLPINVIDITFCVAFVCELCLRLYAFGRLEYFFGEDRKWNRFDFMIVSLSTTDTILSIIIQGEQSPLGNISVLRTVRIIRITRVLRIIRVMKFFKDLRVMVLAISSTLKTATWAFLLLLGAMYMFGIAITQIAAEQAQDKEREGTPMDDDEPLLEWFGSLPKSLFTLFMSISGGIDYENAARPLFGLPVSLTIYMFFILFSSFCVMNVMTGIFCQNAIETFEHDKENVIQCQLVEKARFVDTLTSMFREWDTSGDGHCTREEFENHLSDHRMQVLLRTLDIEARDALQLFGMMDVDETGYLDLEEFIHGCITLRGGAKAVHMERALIDNKITREKLNRITSYVKDISTKVNNSVLATCLTPLDPEAGSPKTATKNQVVPVRRANQKESRPSRQEGQKTLEFKQPVVAKTPSAQFPIADVPSSISADRIAVKSTSVETQKIQPPPPTKPVAPTEESSIFFAPGVVPDS